MPRRRVTRAPRSPSAGIVLAGQPTTVEIAGPDGDLGAPEVDARGRPGGRSRSLLPHQAPAPSRSRASIDRKVAYWFMSGKGQHAMVYGDRVTAGTSFGPGARPQLIRELNERLILDEVRRVGIGVSIRPHPSDRAVQADRDARAGQPAARWTDPSRWPARGRVGSGGPAARGQPDAGYALAIDVGREYVRGALADMAGRRRGHGHAREPRPAPVRHGLRKRSRWVRALATQAGIELADITQTVVGSPGVLDPNRDVITLARSLPGWERPEVLACLREAFGASLVLENDVDAAAIAERVHGHGREVDSFAFLSVGTGIGMGLVIGGKLHRGAHGAAGEIGYLPISDGLRSRREGRPSARPAGSRRVGGGDRAGGTAQRDARRVVGPSGVRGRGRRRRARDVGRRRGGAGRGACDLRGRRGRRPAPGGARRRRRSGARIRRCGCRAVCVP